MKKSEIIRFLKNKRFQWILTIILLLITVFWSTSIRLSNWNNLNDQTTGEKIPSDLDAFYYLRVAEKIVEGNGSLPEYDNMRYNPLKLGFTSELMPRINVLLYNIANNFGNYTIAEVNAFLPVLAFFIGIILFFLFVYFLTDSKFAAISSTILLSFIPSYLQRTVGGFSDHDSLGITVFFLFLVIYTLSLKYIEKKRNVKGALIYGLVTSFFTAFATVSWGGVTTYIYLIVPLSFLILWLTNIKNEKLFAPEAIAFYSSWLILSPLMGIFFNLSPINFIKGYMLSTVGLISIFVFVFMWMDLILFNNKDKIQNIKSLKLKYRALYSLALTILAGIIILPFLGINILKLISSAWTTIFHPWGLERITLTVAENAQPYLTDIIGNFTKMIFWMFFAGLITIGFLAFSKIKKINIKIASNFFWIVMVCGALFSRISPSSLFQGTNFISQAVYIISLISFAIYFIWLYFTQEELKISPRNALIISLALFLILTLRASMRHVFAINPFVCMIAGLFIYQLYEYLKKNKGEIIRPILIVLLILSSFVAIYSVYNFQSAITAQAKQIGPSANYQWQNAMEWVRENTNPKDIFIHWWDYGYWVQYLGKRPSVTDGGHGVPYWDHLIGRYLLTTTKSETAFSLMKTYNASYLLIDPTDLGKYPAYSIIGSDESGKDRYSAIPVMALDPRQTVERANETVLVYTGGVFVDEDINYELNGKKVFLPLEKAVMAGVIWKVRSAGQGNMSIERPTGVYFYNNQRYDIPIRYLYVNNQLIDSGQGLDAVLRIIPSFDGSQGINNVGASIYLSPKVSKGLFAQLYLLNNSFGNFDGIKLVHSQDDIVAQSLRQQGAPVDEFIFYGGFRGPIKIWKIDYPEETLEREEFLKRSGEYAELDNLNFVK